MDERELEERPINGRPDGEGRLRAGLGRAKAPVNSVRSGAGRSVDGVRAGAGRTVHGVRAGADRTRLAVEDAAWFMRERVAWPVEDGLDALGTRGRIGVFGGGGIAIAGVVAALVIATSGGSSNAGTTEAFVTAPRPTPTTAVVSPTPQPKKKATKPSGPTLHGAPPSFAPAKDVHSGVAAGQALESKKSDATGEAPAARGSSAGAGETPASTARIGATPQASAAATAQASSLEDSAINSDVPKLGTEAGAGEEAASGPPAPKAAKRVARHFAEAFVVYETGGVDSGVRDTFGATSTKQLSKSLLKRPPRQPAGVKVPQAKVVNVVAGPSQGKVYSVSVSLLRVGVTSELRLQMEQGVGKKWQVTNVLG